MSIRNAFFLAITAFAFTAFTSCAPEDDFSDDKNESGQTPDPTPKPLISNFKFLTVNPANYYGEAPSITHVSHEGATTQDIYFQANNALVTDGVTDVALIDDKLYMTITRMNSSYYTDCSIEVLNAETFVSEETIDLSYNTLGSELSVKTITAVPGDKLIAAGTLFYSAGGDGDNLAVISRKDHSLEKTLRFDFPISKVIYAENKIFLAGAVANAVKSKIAVLDLNNITEDGLRVISDETNLFDGSTSILKDANGLIWAAVLRNGTPAVLCIDPATEQIVHDIRLPYSITSLSSVSATMDEKAETLYIRCGRAFYVIDAKNPAEPDDVAFEITSGIVDGGMTCLDLKMSQDGKLLFIRSIMTQGEVSQVYELDPADWTVTNIYPTGINSRFIYVAQE